MLRQLQKGNIWRPFDLLIVGMVLLLAALPLLFRGERGGRCEVRVAGVPVRQIALSEAGEYRFAVADGEIVLRVEAGGARVVSSPCPDGDCMRMGAIEKGGQTLACLPERFVAEITGAREVDTYVG